MPDSTTCSSLHRKWTSPARHTRRTCSSACRYSRRLSDAIPLQATGKKPGFKLRTAAATALLPIGAFLPTTKRARQWSIVSTLSSTSRLQITDRPGPRVSPRHTPSRRAGMGTSGRVDVHARKSFRGRAAAQPSEPCLQRPTRQRPFLITRRVRHRLAAERSPAIPQARALATPALWVRAFPSRLRLP